MKLSKEVRYGTRAMVELAACDPGGALSAKEIAQRQSFSVKFLEQILRTLKSAGLIEATRGSRGGYRLSRPPQSIKLSAVYGAIEGHPNLVECIDRPNSCPMSARCPTRDLWNELTGTMVGVLEATTLQDLVDRKIKKSDPATAMYHI